MGDKNPKKRPKQKKVNDKMNQNLQGAISEEEHHGKSKKTY